MNEKPITYTLPNGKTLVLNYLSQEELYALLKVPTTVYQAKKIRKRNLLLWKKFNDNDTSKSKIGCPHCKYNYEEGIYSCSKCAWKLYPKRGIGPCTEATFGSVLLGDQRVVTYSPDSEQVNDGILRCIDGEAEETEDFLLGHVEWARAIILQGGIPWPNGKLTAKRQLLGKLCKW